MAKNRAIIFLMKINIQNFQSIQDLNIEASKFTIIRGKNNIGKSALYRSVKSLFRNRAGEDFIRRGKPGSKVHLQYTDHDNKSHDITWSKMRKTSSDYIHNGTPHFKIDRKTPDFVYDIGAGEIIIGDKRIDPHFSSQNEPPFLMGSSGALITNFFSEVLQLGSISKALSSCSKDLKEFNTEKKVLEREEERIKQVIKSYTVLDGLEEGSKQLILLNSDIKDLTLKSESLIVFIKASNILNSVSISDADAYEREYTSTVLYYKRFKLLSNYNNIQSVEYNYRDYTGELLYLKYLNILSQDVSLKISVDKGELDTIKDTLNRLNLLSTFNKVKIPQIGLKYKQGEMEKELNMLMYLNKHISIQKIHNKLQALQESLDSLQSEIDKIKICPTCGQKIS